MKRLLPFAPIIFLALLNGCDSFGSPPESPGFSHTSVIQTLTATMWTPTPTPSFNPNIPTMVTWLNGDLLTANSLGWILDAEYVVTNVSLSNMKNSQALEFRVDVLCKCVNGTECCITERTFVLLIGSLKRNGTTIMTQVPGGVSRMLVVCSDHKKHIQIGAMSASWQDVTEYLLGHLTDQQFGVRVTRAAIP